MKYQRYKRGNVVIVDFSPSIGSEIQGKHLAIVLTKNDSPNNGVLTVIPLSSKAKPYYLKIENFLSKQVIPLLSLKLKEQNEKHFSINDSQNADETIQNIKAFSKLLKIYQNMNVDSYAMIQNISTVSKLRILKPINKFDPIGKIKIDNSTLDLIDLELIKLFTKQT